MLVLVPVQALRCCRSERSAWPAPALIASWRLSCPGMCRGAPLRIGECSDSDHGQCSDPDNPGITAARARRGAQIQIWVQRAVRVVGIIGVVRHGTFSSFGNRRMPKWAFCSVLGRSACADWVFVLIILALLALRAFAGFAVHSSSVCGRPAETRWSSCRSIVCGGGWRAAGADSKPRWRNALDTTGSVCERFLHGVAITPRGVMLKNRVQ